MRNAGLEETQAGIKIAGRDINNLRYAEHHPYGRKWRGTKKPLDESESGDWKVGLKLNMQKMKIMASGPITSWEIDGETVEQCQTLYFWAPKSLQMVTAGMKLKEAYSLEVELWLT